MRLVLLANQNWGVQSIRALMRTSHKILTVYTHPREMDKHERVWYESVKEECDRNNIEVAERITLSAGDTEYIRALSPDVLFSIGWRRLIPKSIYEIPKYRSINLHEGLLPFYRGFAPTNWSIINGERESGVTAHYIDDRADTGDIILQRKVSIEPDDTGFNLYNKTLSLFPDVLLETLELIESGNVKSVKQNGRGFFCSRRFPKDGKINWSCNRENIYNLIRALSDPYPNAFCFYQSNKIYIKKARLINDDYRGLPGRICAITADGIIVTCGSDHSKNQAILITEVATDDKGFCHPKEIFKSLWTDLE